MAWPLLAALVLLFGYAAGVHQQVGHDCKGQSSENFLDRHMSYEYRYHGLATTLSLGTTDLQDKMDIRCDVKIQHSTHCLFQLELKSCRLTALQDTSEGKVIKKWIDDSSLDAVNEYPVSFTLNDGEVKHVFHDPRDPAFSLNIKRGILSAFVLRKSEFINGAPKKTQVDVHGTCPAEVTHIGEGEALLKKDMLHCAVPSRKDWNLSPYSLFWNMSFIQYVINSTAECTYNSDGKSLQKVRCLERHAIMLESTQRTTTAVQTLIDYTMEQVSAGRNKGPNVNVDSLTKSGISLEHEEPVIPKKSPADFESIALQMLGDLVSTTQDEMKLFTIEIFNKLVAWLRASPNLDDLTSKVADCQYLNEDCSALQQDLGVSYFQDALVQCNTGPCLKGFASLVEQKKIPRSYLDLAILSWTNARNFDPERISAILSVCKSSNYRFCWLGLSGIIHNYWKEIGELDELTSDIIEHIEFVANYPKNMECSIKDNKPLEVKISAFKIIGNLGEVAQLYNRDISDHLATCATNQDIPVTLRVPAVEAMRKMNLKSSTYSELLKLLKDEETTVSVRSAAYLVLISHFHSEEFLQELVTLLKSEDTIQIKSLVSSDLRDIVNREGDRTNGKIISSHLKRILEQEQFELESIPVNKRASSVSVTTGGFGDFTFMPKEGEGFGSLLREELLYSTFSAMPETYHMNLTFELFSKVFHLIEAGLQSGGWEGVALKTSATLMQLKDPNALQYFMLMLQQLSGQPVRTSEQPKPIYVLDKKIEDSISALKKILEGNQQDLKPYLLAYVRLFGNDLDVTTLGDIVRGIQKIYQRFSTFQPNSFNKKSFSANSTHVLKFVEAYHQFPTMMGLPLNWTTNAALAFSVRTGLDINLRQGQSGKVGFYVHPSAAVTFINRMVLDLPTFTSIGVQSNSSAYTSTKWDWEILKLPNGPVKVSMKAPTGVQRVLELNRKNYYIRGNEVEELEDWDIDREESVKCQGEKFEKVTGMRVCVDQSYPDVTTRVKPWFLMAGWAKWRLTAEMTDPDVKSYDMSVEFQPGAKPTSKEMNVNFEAPGSVWKRSVPIKLVVDMPNQEFDLGMSHSDFPDFNFRLSRNKVKEGGEHIGYESNVAYNNDGKEYTLAYSKGTRQEERKDDPMSRNKSPKTNKVVATIHEKKLQLRTPYNYYLFNSKVHNVGENLKVEASLNYENSDRGRNWLPHILPSIFWENDHKAWIQLRGHWRAPVYKGKDNVQILTTTELGVPYSTIEVVTQSVEKSKQAQFHMNITKRERSSGNLLTFFNFSKNSWQKISGKASRFGHSLNLTIPRHSWAADVLVENKPDESLHKIELTRAKMIHKDESDSFFVSWWHPSHSDRFEHKEWKIIYDQRLKNRAGTDKDFRESLQDKLSSSIDNGEDYGDKKVTAADVRLTYPFKGRQEFIDFNGTFKFLGNKSPAYYSFMKDFVMKSSLHNLQLDSTSTYLKTGPKQKYFAHKSFFTNTETQRNQGTYEIEYTRDSKEGCAYLIDFKHEITAHWLNYKSHTAAYCKPGNPKAKLVNLDIHAHHPYWQELDYDVRQTFDFDLPGGESMNLTSATMDIAVVGDWARNHYGKKAVFTSKTDLFPNTVWEIKGNPYSAMELSIKAPDQELNEVTVRRQLNQKHNKFDYAVFHKDLGSDVEHHDFALTLLLTSPHSILIKGEVHEELGGHMYKWLSDRTKRISERIAQKLYHPESQLNQNMVPMLGTTVGGYIDHLGEEFQNLAESIRREQKSALETFSPFYLPSLQIISNTGKALHHLARGAEQSFRQTIPGWAFYYFEVPSVLGASVSSFPSIVHSIARTFWTGSARSGKAKFYEIIEHPFTWRKITELPQLALEASNEPIYRELGLGSRSIYLEPPRREPQRKFAMIFGKTGVMTFDGKVYHTPVYPKSDCSYLLAHDARAGMFSLASTQNTLYAIFPGVAVTVDNGAVYINATKTDTSLPYRSQNKLVTVTREGSVIRIDMDKHIRIQCDVEDFFCVFIVNSLYHSGTVGLLGNANGNQRDDFKGPDGQAITSVSELLSTYEVTQQPFCRKSIEPATPKPPEHFMKHCRKFLESSLSLQECSEKVGFDPEAFVTSCALEEEKDESCYTSNALLALCRYHGLEHRGGCDSCRQRVAVQPSWTVHSTHKLEVVLVVDQHISMISNRRSQFLKAIEVLTDNIDEIFQNDGYSSVTFSLVSFASTGEGPSQSLTLHTLNKDIWVVEKDIATLLGGLRFEGSVRSNPLQALEFAIKAIPYENSASKIALLLTVDDEVFSSSSQHLYECQKLLEDSGLTLYTFSSFPTISKGKKLFGLRADGYVFPQAGGEDYMTYPRTPLAKLTSGTRGSIFLKQFLDENTNVQFVYGVSEEILAKVGKETRLCKSCHCARNHLWTRNLYCKPAECPKN